MFLAAALTLTMANFSAQHPDNPRMNWWREAKFGMFIHWGLYSVPAGEWNGETRHAEWIRDTARIPVGEYETLLAKFNPVKYNPKVWVALAKEAGMRYVVITSKHHDGFALYDSKLTDWDIASTPYKKDLLQPLADACKDQGLRFCTYHSIMDWHHPDYLPRRPWELPNRPVGAADMSRFVQFLHGQVEEIATKYDPGIMWFDGQWEGTWTTDLGKDLLALCRRVRPNMIVNNRVNSGPQGGGDYLTPEQEVPEEAIQGRDWETCMTLNRNWGYNRADMNYKSTKQVIQLLCDIVSKGGNFLLNVGPTAEGEIPPESVKRLKEVGEWMKVYGDSIYGTTASPFGKLSWGRCTAKATGASTTLFLHVFEWPSDRKLTVSGLGSEVRSASLMGGGAVPFRQSQGELTLELPGTAPSAMASVLKVEIKGKPIVYHAPEIVAESEQFVNRLKVAFQSSPGLEVAYTLDGSEPNLHARVQNRVATLDRTATVKARAFHKGQPVTAIVERRFEKVEPHKAGTFKNLVPGMEVRLYEGNWDRCPEFTFMPDGYTTKVLPTISVADDPAKEYCGRFYRGVIEVPETEMYKFALSSDDGSRLWVSGRLVVDNDGLHSVLEKSGAVALEKGKHFITVEWFNKTGGAQLSVKMAKIGGTLKELTAKDLWHPKGAPAP